MNSLYLPLLIFPLLMALILGGGGVTTSSKLDRNISLGNLPSWIGIEMIEAAIQIQKETGYPASVVLGQSILEAGVGGSELSNPPYYNCLGQKSPSFGQTGVIRMNTREAWGYQYDGFSTFASYVDCMRAWSYKFDKPPYAFWVNQLVKNDRGYYSPNAFIEAIWKAGYATDPNYVPLVIQVMTNFDLYRFNDMSLDEVGQEAQGDIRIEGSGKFAFPCPDYTYKSSYFGEYRASELGGHKGNDYAGSIGTSIYCAYDGVVLIANFSNSAGNWIVIDHGGGLVTKYMHMSQLLVSAGMKVKKGQKIGLMGSTGWSTGSHLHFQVEEFGVPVNPDKYL